MRVENQNYLEMIQQSNTSQEQSGVSVSISGKTEKAADVEHGYRIDKTLTGYEKPNGNQAAEEIASEIDTNQSALSKHNEMAVLSNTMSAEDYEKARKDGFSPETMDGHTIVTVVDKIKMELAASGVDISGMGGSLDEDVIKQYVGSGALASQIIDSLQNADLPLTEDNVKETLSACDMASSLGSLSDDAMAYLLSNNLSPSVSNLYKAQSATSANEISAVLSEDAKSDLKPQMEQVIISAGMQINEDTLALSGWMVANEIPLTSANLAYASDLQSLSFPTDSTRVISAAMQAIAEGKNATDAMLIDGYSLASQAQEITDVIASATDDDIAYLVKNDKEITVENLREAHAVNAAAQTKAAEISESEDAGEAGNGALSNEESDASARNQTADFELRMITARRQLEETRLVMTSEANYKLLKQGISIDTKPLQELVENLKEIETGYYKTLLEAEGASASDDQAVTMQETLAKVSALEKMPAYTLSIPEADKNTLNGLYEAGKKLQLTFSQAEDQYETMRTQVRTDLGDSIKKAFGNTDAILQDMDLPLTAENERAVRILGYNSIELTRENIAEVKALDSQVQRAFSNLTPSTVAKFIKEQKNPLDMQLSDLNEQAEQYKQEDASAEADQFGEYLWKLEKNNQISEDERDSYIGIYRMMHQIEKTDGAAIGALYEQGISLTMRNLFTEVRNEKRQGMDYSVDDSFGGVDAEMDGSILDQAEKVFFTNTLRAATDMLSPEKVRLATSESSWEEQSPEQFAQALFEANDDAERMESAGERIRAFAKASEAEESIYRMLESYDIPATSENIQAAVSYTLDRNSAYRKLFGMGNDAYFDENGEPNFDEIKNDLLHEFGEAIKTPEDMAQAQRTLAEVAENVMRTMIHSGDEVTSLDIKDMKLLNKQISLGSAMAKEETYHIPIMVENEVGDMTLKIVRGKEKKGLVDLMFSSSSLGKVAAQFKADGESVTGFVASDRQETNARLAKCGERFEEMLKQDDMYQETEIRFLYTVDLDLNQFESRDSAKNTPDDEKNSERDAVQTKKLYHTAKSFLNLLNEL